jgi:molybdopterin synthase catalytic subunit
MSVISEQEYITRIAALEKQCATLAAQVDRQALVVDAACVWRQGKLKSHDNLVFAVDIYEQQMAQLAKER